MAGVVVSSQLMPTVAVDAAQIDALLDGLAQNLGLPVAGFDRDGVEEILRARSCQPSACRPAASVRARRWIRAAMAFSPSGP